MENSDIGWFTDGFDIPKNGGLAILDWRENWTFIGFNQQTLGFKWI